MRRSAACHASPAGNSAACAAFAASRWCAITAPKNGALEVRDGKVKTSEKTRCPNLEVSVKAILYKAPAKFRGEDQAVFEIKNAEGELRSVTVKINVSERPAAAPKSDGQDL